MSTPLAITDPDIDLRRAGCIPAPPPPVRFRPRPPLPERRWRGPSSLTPRARPARARASRDPSADPAR